MSSPIVANTDNISTAINNILKINKIKDMERTCLPNMTMNDGTVEMIYKISFFKTKRHKKPIHSAYHLKAEHCSQVFKMDDYYKGLIRVELIPVKTCTYAYDIAVYNSTMIDQGK